jgi:hypothetical protein
MLHGTNAELIQEQITAIAAKAERAIYRHQVLQKGMLDWAGQADETPTTPASASVVRVVPTPSAPPGPVAYPTKQASMPARGSSPPRPGFRFRTKG